MAKNFPHSFEVCKCRSVTLGEIVHSIKERGADSIESVGKLTDAGTCCKCCQSQDRDTEEEKMELYIKQIVEKFVK